MVNKKVLIPLPSYGCDPSETAIPWKLLTDKNIDVQFATPSGMQAVPDRIMLKGEKLGIWKSVLPARKDAVAAFYEMEKTEPFRNPLKYAEAYEKNFDGLLLPGGHDKGACEYLESAVLQKLVADFFMAQKPVGAICHGVVLAARSKNPQTGKSVLHNYKTTALLKKQEMLAYNMTRLWLGDYYLTYPGKTVEDEVTSVLEKSDNFLQGPKPLFRDRAESLKPGFALRDKNYISARWPGDVYNFSLGFIKMIENYEKKNS